MSYDVYASYCPFHNFYRGIAAMLARWKLTRRRNRAAGARGYSAAAGSVGLSSEKYSIETYRSDPTSTTTLKTFGVAKENDAATNPLARWRRVQQDRLAAVQGKQRVEMSVEAAETLRRYEIERVKRMKDFGVRSMSPEVKDAVFNEKSAGTAEWPRRDLKKQLDRVNGREYVEDAITRAPPTSPSTGTLGGSTQRGSGASDDNWL